MNKEVIHKQVTQMAESCGFSRTHTGDVELWLCNKNDLEAFAKLVEERTAAKEREACAIVCDDINAKYKWPDDVAERVTSQWCADSIRARGEAS